MKKIYWKKSIAITLALVVLCFNYVPSMAASEYNHSDQEVSEQVEEFSCWSCGNYSSYITTEYSGWYEFGKNPCLHGKNFDVTEARDVYRVENCTYCHYTNSRTWLDVQFKTSCT